MEKEIRLQGAQGLIQRVLPEYAQQFLVRETEKDGEQERYAFYAEDGKIVLEGSSGVCQAAALYRYLKDCCRVNLSWCGNRSLAVRACPLPEKRTEGTIRQKYRAYMNYCTFCYSAAVWDWERWEKEIDFMALQGINMPLAVVGTEAVWYQTLQDFGFTGEEALSYISGPAYWAWQLMTNIDSFLPPPDASYLKERLELGRKIIEREQELGMMPVMQGFSGHIPKKMKEKYPQLCVLETSSWCGFPTTCQLDPLDPMFLKIGLRYLENQKNMLGYSRFLACDPFHENTPPSTEKEYLHRVGQVIDGLYRSFSEESVWVMQSWSIYRDIAQSVPKGRLLVFDINGHRYEETEGFWGHGFVLGDLHNFGGKNSLHGDIRMLADRSYRSLQTQWPGLCGTGLFMEGINQNPMYYEMSLEHLIREEATDLDRWLADYARRRYGRSREADVKALRLLADACYGTGTSDAERGSILCARPDLDVHCAAPNDVLEQRYDNRKLLKVLELLIGDGEKVTDGWLFDICDFTRQLLSNHALVIYRRMVRGVMEHDREQFRKEKDRFLKLILDLDRLLCTREELLLSRWVSRAEALGADEQMQAYYRKNVLMLITIWGPPERPVIFDYAWREWGGLLKQYYYQRWKIFLDNLEAEFDSFPREHRADVEKAYDRCGFRAEPVLDKIADFELEFLETYRPKPEAAGDTVSVVRQLLTAYREEILAWEYAGQEKKTADLDFWEKQEL